MYDVNEKPELKTMEYLEGWHLSNYLRNINREFELDDLIDNYVDNYHNGSMILVNLQNIIEDWEEELEENNNMRNLLEYLKDNFPNEFYVWMAW